MTHRTQAFTEMVAGNLRFNPLMSNWYEPQSSAERSEAVRNASFSIEAVLVE